MATTPRPAGTVAIVLLTSAWLYLGPLLVLVPAELRYLGWSCLASISRRHSSHSFRVRCGTRLLNFSPQSTGRFR